MTWQVVGIVLLWVACIVVISVLRRWYWCRLHRGAPVCTDRWIVTGKRE